MRKPLLCLLLLLVAASGVRAQFRVTGILKDTVGKQAPQHAVISLLQKKDSSLVTFTRSDAQGRFQTAPVASGNYVLLVTYPKFADLADGIEVKGADLDLGTLALTPKSVLMSEVVIRANNAIRQRGDTTEFTADSFKVREGATVEDLLKKLPGFSVNAKGEITTQGKKVDKVLVDGEEFFGDDPTMATQNLSAKIVDKVQVYETKSEQQSLSSIGTGSEGKTVNIKLKEDKKKGSFGKISAGTDFSDYLEARGLYNRFVGKKKLSAYASRSNVSTGSLNWEDRQKLGMENDAEYDEISGFYYSFGSDDEFNDWSLRGYPESWTGGALFSNRWGADKQSFNGSYRYNRLGTVNNGVETTTYTTAPLSTRNKQTSTNALVQQHAINAKYEFKIDSLATIKYTAAGSYKRTEQFTRTYSNFRNDSSGKLVNESLQDRNDESTKQQLDQQLNWRQAFMKKGRLMIVNLRYGITDDDRLSMIRTDQTFYRQAPLADSTALVDQMRRNTGQSRTMGAKVTWNEPLSDRLNLILEYGYNRNKSESNRNTFNKSSNGKYETLDPVYSNNFELSALSHVGTATVKYMYKKLKFAAGSGISAVQLRLHNLYDDSRTRYNFTNFTPQVQLGYTPKPQMGVNLSYRGSTKQPTIEQLQPIRDNNDPLNVFEGNPNLKVGFNHQFSVSFNQFKSLKQRYLWFNASYNIIEDAIAFSRTIDRTTGKQTYRPVNVDGNRSLWFWGMWSAQGGDKKWGRGIRFNGSGSRRVGFLNGNRSVSDFVNVQIGPSANYNWENHISFEISPEVGYNNSRTRTENLPDTKTKYFTYGGEMNGNLNIGKKWEFNAQVEVQVRQKVPTLSGTPDNYMINMGITRKLFKDNTGKLMLTVNDLLNQNVGFNRTINDNTIFEERYSRVARYVMLRFEWSFTRMPGK